MFGTAPSARPPELTCAMRGPVIRTLAAPGSRLDSSRPPLPPATRHSQRQSFQTCNRGTAASSVRVYSCCGEFST
jgi:hypothetical protein